MRLIARKAVAALLPAGLFLAALSGTSHAEETYEFVQVTKSVAEDLHPAWTPDGLALIFETDRDGWWRLYRYDLPTGEETPLTPSDAWSRRMPEVSHDGQWIVFSRLDAANKGQLCRMPLAGGAETVLTPYIEGVQQAHPTWSLDDQTIYYSYYDRVTNDYDIYQVPAAGGPGTPHYATPVRETFPVVARDGSGLAVAHQFTAGVYNAGVAPFDAPYQVQQLTFRPTNTTITDYHADGRRILFVSRGGEPNKLELFERDVVTGVDRQLTHDSTPAFDPQTHYAVYSPNGDRIAFASRRVAGNNNIWILDLAGTSGVAEAVPPARRLAAAPNPMRERTVITLEAATPPAAAAAGIFDARGRLVRRLGPTPASGSAAWTWDGRDDGGRELPGGAYFVRVADGTGGVTRKILRVR